MMVACINIGIWRNIRSETDCNFRSDCKGSIAADESKKVIEKAKDLIIPNKKKVLAKAN